MLKHLLALQGVLLLGALLVLREIAVAIFGYAEAMMLFLLFWFCLIGLIFGFQAGWKYLALWTPGLVNLASMAGVFFIFLAFGDINSLEFRELFPLALVGAFLVAFLPTVAGRSLKIIVDGHRSPIHWVLLLLCGAAVVALFYFFPHQY